MKSPAQRGWIGAALLFALVYPVAGAGFARLPASSQRMIVAWRLAAWAVSLLALLGQVIYERFLLLSPPRKAALHTAFSVALGGLLLAAAGPVRSHWGTATQGRAVLSLATWPLIMAVPSFFVALVFGTVLGRLDPTLP